MPRHPRTHNGIVRKASQRIPFLLPDGFELEDLQGGPAQNEMLDGWPGKSGGEPVPGEEIAAGAVRGDESNEVRGDGTPPGAWVFFVAEPEAVAKDGHAFRPARMVTAEAPPEQAAYFRDARFALLGIMNPDGSISIIEPLTPPVPEPPAQGELI